MRHQQSAIETQDRMMQLITRLQQQQTEDRILLKNIQKHLSTSNNVFPGDFSQVKKNTLSYHFARDITSVVGLTEAFTWKSTFLRCVWFIALCIGVAATVYFVFQTWVEYMNHPTATKAAMVRKSSYTYPSILLCPNLWLDADKALSLGLSLEGLKYSLGYVNGFEDKVGPDHNSLGRQDFLNFFEKSNSTSLDEYLMNISIDIPLESSKKKYEEVYYSSAYCPRCNVTFLPKVTTSSGVCYNFKMEAEPGRRRLSSVSRLIGMQISDRSRGLISTSLWSAYLTTDKYLNLKKPVAPRAIIKSFTYTGIRFHETQFHFESTTEYPCLSGEQIEKDYAPTTCITQCLTPLYSRVIKCTPLEAIVGITEYHPTELCNTFDDTISSAFSDLMENNADSVLNSSEAKECYKKCPYTCDRTRYEMIQDGEHSGADDNNASAAMIEQARLLNTTFVDIFIENAAMYQGGVMTLCEINTISFIELISNVGGALGLFVGCTMMTFVQIVLSFFKQLSEKTKKSSAERDVPRESNARL